jgi:DNA-binding transcriptional MerR regulator
MVSPRGIAERYVDQVRLSLSGRRYLTEQQERALLLEGLDIGLTLEEAREILAATATNRGAAREITLDHDMELTIGAVAGDKGWISRTSFDRAAHLFQQLSGGAISAAEARGRVKGVMLRRGCKVRGEIIFGTPHWFRDIPTAW